MKTFKTFGMALLAIFIYACGSDAPKDVEKTDQAPSGDTTAVVVASKAEPSALQGKWQSDLDPAYFIEFKGDSIFHVYSGQVTGRAGVEVVKDCAAAGCVPGQMASNQFCFLEKTAVEVKCNHVLRVDGTQLEFKISGSSGASMLFNKQK